MKQQPSMHAGFVPFAATMGGLAVVLGAFGAHALKGELSSDALGWWQTAVQYQMWHALALLAIGLSGARWAKMAALLIGAGMIVFCSTLYAMALGAPKWLGAVTPIGGVLMIVGWTLLALKAIRQRSI